MQLRQQRPEARIAAQRRKGIVGGRALGIEVAGIDRLAQPGQRLVAIPAEGVVAGGAGQQAGVGAVDLESLAQQLGGARP